MPSQQFTSDDQQPQTNRPIFPLLIQTTILLGVPAFINLIYYYPHFKSGAYARLVENNIQQQNEIWQKQKLAIEKQASDNHQKIATEQQLTYDLNNKYQEQWTNIHSKFVEARNNWHN